MSEKLLEQYKTFVDGVTSDDSKNIGDFLNRVMDLGDEGCNLPRLLTAAIGMSDESGEFAGIVKKVAFHGKPFSQENKEHLAKELGDVLWYWMQGCIALDLDPNNVINENIKKLESRYPKGEFSIERSENRASNDI